MGAVSPITHTYYNEHMLWTEMQRNPSRAEMRILQRVPPIKGEDPCTIVSCFLQLGFLDKVKQWFCASRSITQPTTGQSCVAARREHNKLHDCVLFPEEGRALKYWATCRQRVCPCNFHITDVSQFSGAYAVLKYMWYQQMFQISIVLAGLLFDQWLQIVGDK